MPRCSADSCNKKLSLTDIQCRCNRVYCSLHRAPETHACAFDYHGEHKQNLLKYMSSPVIAKKLETI